VVGANKFFSYQVKEVENGQDMWRPWGVERSIWTGGFQSVFRDNFQENCENIFVMVTLKCNYFSLN
jgi:hypothetical protein